ncbi:hypothetical protein SK128_013467, partial [Halocaridina rubra]
MTWVEDIGVTSATPPHGKLSKPEEPLTTEANMQLLEYVFKTGDIHFQNLIEASLEIIETRNYFLKTKDTERNYQIWAFVEKIRRLEDVPVETRKEGSKTTTTPEVYLMSDQNDLKDRFINNVSGIKKEEGVSFK